MGALFGGAALAVLPAPPGLLFAAPAAGRSPMGPGTWMPFCGPSPEIQRPQLQMAAGAASLSWLPWGKEQQSDWARTRTPRDWARMYRTLGIAEDSSKEQVERAATRLCNKYAEDSEAKQRVEHASLEIKMLLVSRSEAATKRRQQAAAMREVGNTPRKLFQKCIAGWVPPSIRQMMEVPDTKHFRWTSSLLGGCILLALCVPTQASNCVGLGAASAMGLIYQRNRPEPVKDEMGNVGEVRKINPKEMGATVAIVAIGALLGALMSLALGYVVDTPLQVVFAATTCSVLWLATMFFKVYECFN